MWIWIYLTREKRKKHEKRKNLGLNPEKLQYLMVS